MRKVLLVGAVLLCATVLVAGSTFQPLNVKTGLWQVTETFTITSLPPAMQAMMDRMTPEQRAKMAARSGAPQTETYKKCVTTKDLNTNPFDSKCNWTILNSTSSDMEAQGTSCDLGKDQGMKTDVKVKVHVLDSENAKGSITGTSTGNGQTVNFNGELTGKWIGASCPAGTN